MHNQVFVKNYPAPEVNVKEIARYAGYKTLDGQAQTLIDECLLEAMPSFAYRVCYCMLTAKEALAHFGETPTLAKRLSGAERVVAFAATVGIGVDRLILRYGEVSPLKALLMQAIGAERIESLCDTFCEEMQTAHGANGYKVGKRFSAGYGDFPLSAQTEFFKLLDCSRKIGLTLTDGLLMSPTKSVTALLPIGRDCIDGENACLSCKKQDCDYKK